MIHHSAVAASVLLLLALLTGCGTACSDMGAVKGVTVRIAPGLATVHQLVLHVCSTTGCTDGPVRLLRGPEGRRFGVAGVDGLRGGPVTITGSYRARGAVVRLDELRTRATTNYPNGRDCGADGATARIVIDTDGMRPA